MSSSYCNVSTTWSKKCGDLKEGKWAPFQGPPYFPEKKENYESSSIVNTTQGQYSTLNGAWSMQKLYQL